MDICIFQWMKIMTAVFDLRLLLCLKNKMELISLKQRKSKTMKSRSKLHKLLKTVQAIVRYLF